jgi:hypothetical protein
MSKGTTGATKGGGWLADHECGHEPLRVAEQTEPWHDQALITTEKEKHYDATT